MISPWDHRVVKLVTLTNFMLTPIKIIFSLLTNITTVTEPPKIIERGRNFERLSCKHILSLETGGSSSLSISAFVERASIFSS